MALDKATVAHIATLARIRLTEAELALLAEELSQILDWVEQLNEIDTSAVEPMASVAASGLPMRDDRVTDGNRREEILGNAPRTAPPSGKAGFFAVPKVIE
jgi:aspartyl-tRNA(Asn)/glutamyl-tRNA(Gln) amidotransferase subunit C